jgi:hypothetical protein
MAVLFCAQCLDHFESFNMTPNLTEKPWWRSWGFWAPFTMACLYFMTSGKKAPLDEPPASATSGQAALSAREIEEACATQLQRELQAIFESKKQELFSAFHPLGTAKSVVVHDLTINGWKHGKATGREDDVLGFSTRFTIYWEGPVVKDGFTKVSANWDGESKRWYPGQIIATNGMTNDQATALFIDIAGAAFAEALRNRGN